MIGMNNRAALSPTLFEGKSSALTTRLESWTMSIDQPTMRRLQVSSTQQR